MSESDEILFGSALDEPAQRAPSLIPIRMSCSEDVDHPEIDEGQLYLCQIGERYHAGRFSRGPSGYDGQTTHLVFWPFNLDHPGGSKAPNGKTTGCMPYQRPGPASPWRQIWKLVTP